MECEICKKNKAIGVTNILSKKFISACNYHRINSNKEIISYIGDNNSNIVYVCDGCISKLENVVCIPLTETSKLLCNLNKDKLRNYAKFIYVHKDQIMNYLSEQCLRYDNNIAMFMTNMRAMLIIKDMQEFLRIYENVKDEL